MPTTWKELYQKAQKFYDSKDYNEVIALLSDQLLESKEYQKAELYVERAKAYWRLKKMNEGQSDLNKALALDKDYAPIYNCLGNILSDMGQNIEAIEKYTQAIKLDPKYSNAYYNRGITKSELGRYEEAIKDYDEAIKINPKLSEAYNNRANSKNSLGHYQEAIEDYNTAIKLNPNDEIAHNNIGAAKGNLGLYKEAFEYYNKAIELNPNYVEAYNNMAVEYTKLGNYDNAIKYFDDSIKIDPKFWNAYYNKGIANYSKQLYQQALDNFNESLVLNPSDTKAIYWREQTLQKLNNPRGIEHIKPKTYSGGGGRKNTGGEIIVAGGESGKTQEDKYPVLTFFKKLCEGIKDGVLRNNLEQLSSEIYFEQVIPILDIATDVNVHQLAHYTKLHVADTIICSRNEKTKAIKGYNSTSRLRYYNSGYMNDPKEGRILLEFFNKEDDDDVLKSFLAGEIGEESNVYIGSLVEVNDNDDLTSHDDDLVLWRTYGKDGEKNEGCGCCLVIDQAFFDKHTKPAKGSVERLVSDATKQHLYKIIYCDRKRNIVSDGGDEIKRKVTSLGTTLKRMVQFKNTASDGDKAIIDKLIFHLISEVRFFFKQADFQYENELRVLKFVPPNSTLVKYDENDKLYIESNKFITKHIKKLVLGPKVPNPEHWIFFSAVMAKAGFKFELRRSKIDFR